MGNQVTAYNPSTHTSSTQTVQHVWVNHNNDLLDVTVMRLMRAADEQGATINAIGATRPVCTWHQERLLDSILIVTELKR